MHQAYGNPHLGVDSYLHASCYAAMLNDCFQSALLPAKNRSPAETTLIQALVQANTRRADGIYANKL